MKELLLIAIGSALVNNVVLSQFLGICPFLGVSKRVETSAGIVGRFNGIGTTVPNHDAEGGRHHTERHYHNRGAP